MRKATLLISSTCNHKCDFCLNIWENKHNKEKFDTFMKLDLFNHAVDVITEYGINSITICGGEPLLHPDFKEMINLLHSKNVFIRLQTNGVYLTEEMSHFLANKVAEIEISLHGTKQIQNKISGFDSFDKIVKNMKYAQSVGLLITSNFVINTINHHDLENYIYLINKLELIASYFTVLYEAGKTTANLKLSKKEMSDFISKLAKYSRIGKTKLMFQGCYPPCELDSMEHSITFMSPCGAGKDEIAVQPNGMLTLCPAHPKPIGYMKDITLCKFNNLLGKGENYLAMKELPKSECPSCPLLNSCRGGCVINREGGTSNILLNQESQSNHPVKTT